MGCFCAKIYVMLKQLRENCNYFNITAEVERSINKASEAPAQAPPGLPCAGSHPVEAEVPQADLRSRCRYRSCPHAHGCAHGHVHE